MNDTTKGAIDKVHIALGERSYDIHIGASLISRIQDFVPFDLDGRKLFVITDKNVAPTHAAAVQECLQACGAQSTHALVLPAGEQTKSFAEYERLMGWLLDQKADRDSVIFAVGGGVVGDLAGFAAATMMRGIPFVQVPTTLLAQVDSAVGGKTAINMPQGKNLVGAFYQPCSVVIDIDTLQTLPEREIKAGYAEVAKYGLINDAEFFVWLEKEGANVCALEPQALVKAIGTSCRKKAEIVGNDEKESGERKLLNLGHTFGHALEAVAGYDGRLLHGEAVAIGTVIAFHLSARLGLCDDGDAERVEEHFRAIGLPTRAADISPALDTTAAGLMGYMAHDKKTSMGRLTYIIVNGIGKAHVSQDIAAPDVEEILKQSMDGI